MKQLLLLIPFAMLITACNPLVKIHVSYHVPYCGGKLPNESEAQGEILPMANHGYIVQESLLHPAKEKAPTPMNIIPQDTRRPIRKRSLDPVFQARPTPEETKPPDSLPIKKPHSPPPKFP